MNKNIIISYIKNISLDKFLDFINKENINISMDDSYIIYDLMHNNTSLLVKDPLLFIENNKNLISLDAYNYLINYYYEYEDIIKNFI